MDFSSWEQWIQQVGSKSLDAAISKTVTQPYQLQAMKMQSYGDYGYYMDGQPGMIDPATGLPVQRSSISPMILIGGALILAVVLIKS